MLFLGLSVPGEVPRCSASVLVLLAGFLNSDCLCHIMQKSGHFIGVCPSLFGYEISPSAEQRGYGNDICMHD